MHEIKRKSAKLSFHHMARKKCTQLRRKRPYAYVQRRHIDAMPSIMLKKTSFNPGQRRRAYSVMSTVKKL
jgi:hypothetical protein